MALLPGKSLVSVNSPRRWGLADDRRGEASGEDTDGEVDVRGEEADWDVDGRGEEADREEGNRLEEGMRGDGEGRRGEMSTRDE